MTALLEQQYNEVLVKSPLIDVDSLNFVRAKKTKPLRAKPMAQILVDPSVREKFLLQTLEGNQILKAGSIMCVGIGNDAWQQTQANLFKKYTVESVDDNGWMTCQPKPENEVQAAEITEEFKNTFSLKAQWGEEYFVNGAQTFLQFGITGDFVLRRPDDNSDLWIVARKMFLATYEFI